MKSTTHTTIAAFNTPITIPNNLLNSPNETISINLVNNFPSRCITIITSRKVTAKALDEQVETYNDLRRLKAMGEEYVILTNPRNTQSGINRYPERLPYGNSAVIGNPDVKEAYGDGSYIYSEKTWINGGK